MLALVAIVFTGAFAQSALGFGFALLAMPLLSLLMPISSAASFVAVTGLVISAQMLAQDWRNSNFKAARSLLIGACIGVPLGLYALSLAPSAIAVRVLGTFIIAMSAYLLLQPGVFQLAHHRWKYLFGFIAGLFGGAYNISGPVIVLYGATQKWHPSEFRQTLQAFFLPTNMAVIASHAVAGHYEHSVLVLLAYGIPSAIIAVILGRQVNKRINQEQFTPLVYIICMALGALLIFEG
ncbi:MAG: sulfite exporter TauE/SafE family protein [Pseudomonadota bacterium]